MLPVVSAPLVLVLNVDGTFSIFPLLCCIRQHNHVDTLSTGLYTTEATSHISG
jgi:hypothetical protein